MSSIEAQEEASFAKWREKASRRYQTGAMLMAQSECERNARLEYESVEEYKKRKVIFAILRALAPVGAK